MTLLGKFFSGLVLFLSIVFLTLAIAVNATHRNWREVVLDPATGLKAQVEQVESVNRQLRESLQQAQNDLAQEQAARRTALAALQTRLDQLDAELRRKVAEVQTQEAALTELAQQDRSRTQELERVTSENSELRSQIQQEREARDKLFVRATTLTDQLNTLRGLYDIEQERHDQLMAQMTRYKEVIDAYGINPNDPIDRAPPERKGVVLAVNNDNVEISIGEDEGLRRGHELDVTRGGQYLGRVRVKATGPDRAAAEILKDYRQGLIREGDSVDTTR